MGTCSPPPPHTLSGGPASSPSAGRPHLQVSYVKLGAGGRKGVAEGSLRVGKKDGVKGGVLRRRDPVFVCSPWPGGRKPGLWLPR